MTNTRQQFIDALKKQVEENVFKHSLSVEACMNGLYDYFNENSLLDQNEPSKEEWALGGLIHDIDYGSEFKNYHPKKTEEVLKKYNLNVSKPVLRIVKAHAPELTSVKPQNKAEWSIFCADSLTGLITAVALILPSKKLADVKLKSVLKRFLKEPKFAAGTRRNEVAMCGNKEGLNLPLEKFVEICLSSMQKISTELGL